MSNNNYSFTKIANNIIQKTSCINKVETKGLYVLMASFYNNFYHKTNSRGDKAYFRTLNTDGKKRFEKSWKQLYAIGLLKREAYPLEKNCFENIYRLLAKPDKSNDHLYYGTYNDIRKGLHLTKRYDIPEKGYTQISNTLIRDNALSLEAKGLYVLLNCQVKCAP